MYLTEFDKNIIDQMKSFGFRHHSTSPTYDGTVMEYVYKYYPIYLIDTHYTLIIQIHTYGKSNDSDHRLIICNNSDGSYVDCVYIVKNSSEYYTNLIRNYIAKIFVSEIRTITINEILL